VIIQFCSAPCGSGKTYQLVKSACRLANGGETVLLLQPTKELIDKTIADRLSRLSSAPLYEKFYGGSQDHSVAWDLTEHLKTVTDGGHIVFLIYEKLRGKPASEQVRAAATYVGLALILCLMVFVLYLDVKRL